MQSAVSMNELMNQAMADLAHRRLFDCQDKCLLAMAQARHDRDFGLIARIGLALSEARRQIQLKALAAGVQVLSQPMTTDAILAQYPAGCLLLAPPAFTQDQVDDLQRLAYEQHRPIMVLLFDAQAGRDAFCSLAEDAGNHSLADMARDLPAEAQVQKMLDMLDHVGAHEQYFHRLVDIAEQAARVSGPGADSHG